MHNFNELATSKRKYHSGHDVVRNLEKSLELDTVLYISGKVISNLDSCFKLIESFKDKSLPHRMFSDTSKLGSWIDVANDFNDLFASNFNTNSYETRIPDDSQSLIFFNDFCGTFSDFDTLQVILNSTTCTYETHDNFPNGLLKNCSGLFETLFRIVFNCVILNCQFPEIWKPSFIKPINIGAFRNDITNYRPSILLPKVSLIFEKLVHKFLIDLPKNKIYQRQYGFYDLSAARIRQLPLSQKGRQTILNIIRLRESLRSCATFRSTSETPKNWSGLEFCFLL